MSGEQESGGERGTVIAVCVGPGGIPNHPVESAHADANGLEGDAHRFHLHGGADRAVCLITQDEVDALERDGVPKRPHGAFGENLRLGGIDPSVLRPGDRLAIGDEAVIELFEVREPCKTLRSLDARFPDLMVGRSGWVGRVVEPGELRAGQSVVRRPAAD